MNAPAKAAGQIGSGLWTADQFLEFYMSRPDEERWQLVDGLAMMMVSPTRPHQKIAKNLIFLLEPCLLEARSDLETLWEMGVRVPGISDFNPQPDLLVVEADASFERYADRFFLAAEILSPSNPTEMISRKIELYQRHPDNLYCLTIAQDEVRVRLWARETDWQMTELTSLDDKLRLPAFGFDVKLSEIYRGTSLAA
ncbi:Uma2 family endonuclease [Afifella marina]|uniref:Endonuclease, Uma2 family (Restriction endonuclease fold) n=2 Tax=Hyphomicrobiales TaxID=356 RepID=A0A1G5MAP5_AFIMA|nr:Uma2 family endonuclease [Afifella marina]MBK1622697.1 Uma2 family endonuclease [Afifella marina DSM 2698]MBK1625692.1 Uma2 family endonuclease [Afifella marina]MBK5917515.1 hypothetical protein [Afifella marina]RAI23450.1 hypothetical protein CH311_00780 [Afifella marina DSM 2698]SCZ22292.1 Endonuclease, Uma2 family (restriction endonuclease fold) [Afifella marina DSM 2698]